MSQGVVASARSSRRWVAWMKQLLPLAACLAIATLFAPGAALVTAQTVPYCGPSQAAKFRTTLATLKRVMGTVMGDPIECEHFLDDTGHNTSQLTTTGQAMYLEQAGPYFTNGTEAWLLFDGELMYLSGPRAEWRAINPPAGQQPAPSLAPVPTTRPLAAPTRAPLPPAADARVAGGAPPLGRYNCYYTGLTGNYGGWLKLLTGGVYQEGYGDAVRGQGFYTYDGTLTWSGGPYDIAGWDGLYWLPGRYGDGSVRTGTGQDQHIIALRKRGDARPIDSGASPFPLRCYGLYSD